MSRIAVPTLSALVAVAVVGCGGHPQSYMSPVDLSQSDAYSCAMEFVNEQGYTVQNADKESGIIQARRESSGLVAEALSGERTWQVLSISIFEGSSKGDEPAQRMNVTAAKATQGVLANAFGTGSIEEGGTPTDETKQDAQNLIEECGGTVTTAEGAANGSYRIESRL